MKITKRREIVLTRERRVTVKFGNDGSGKFCRACNRTGQFITVDEAALIGNVSRQTIFQLIGTGKIHLDESSERLLRVCLQSLTDFDTIHAGEKYAPVEKTLEEKK